MSNILKSWFLPVSFIPSSSVPLSFIHGSVHYTENIKGIRTWKMPCEINNNIFHGANKLQEKNTWAFSNWTLQIKSLMTSAPAKHFQRAFSNRTLQIKSLMKSAPTKHFQNLVRCNSYYKSSPDYSVHFICYACQLEPIITSFTLTTGHFTKYKSSPDMYNGIIFISIKMF